MNVSMFTDEALDSVSISSLWRESQQSAQESVCLNNSANFRPRSALLGWIQMQLIVSELFMYYINSVVSNVAVVSWPTYVTFSVARTCKNHSCKRADIERQELTLYCIKLRGWDFPKRTPTSFRPLSLEYEIFNSLIWLTNVAALNTKHQCCTCFCLINRGCNYYVIDVQP